MDALPLEEWQQAWQGAVPGGGELRQVLLQLARGEISLSGAALLQQLMDFFLGAVKNSLWRLSALIAPAVFFGMLHRMRSAFSRPALGEALSAACFLLIAFVLARDLGDQMALARQSIARMADLMEALFPLLLTLMAALGGAAGAAFFQPALTAASGTMIALVRSITLPLALGAAVTAILDHLSPRIHLGRLSAFFKSAASWTLGIGFTVFISVTALQSLGMAAADGVGLRTAKYAVDHFVPVVGGMFADTMDTLVGASLLIKNALGMTGLAALFGAAAGPMLNTLAAAMLYRACAALMEPLAQERIGSCIQEFANILMLLFIVQLTVGAMFILLVAQMLAVGNWTVMLR